MAVSRNQCCPMDTYDTDSAGDLRAVCSCGDDCDCTCTGCICANWGEEYPENSMADIIPEDWSGEAMT